MDSAGPQDTTHAHDLVAKIFGLTKEWRGEKIDHGLFFPEVRGGDIGRNSRNGKGDGIGLTGIGDILSPAFVS